MKFFLSQTPMMLTIILAACGTSNFSDEFVSSESTSTDMEVLADPSEKDPSIAGVERKIIRNGSIHFTARNMTESDTFLKREVAEIGGYVSEESSNVYGDRTEKRMTIRVKADSFEPLIEKIKAHALKVDNSSIQSEDVTEEYIDINARLKTKKDLELRYSELLKKSQNVPEILQIERELAKVRGEIESIQGRLNYLSNRTKMSTLMVSFYIESVESFSFFSKLGQGITNGMKNLQWFIIYLVNLWPFILGIGLLLFFLIRKKKTPPPPMK